MLDVLLLLLWCIYEITIFFKTCQSKSSIFCLPSYICVSARVLIRVFVCISMCICVFPCVFLHDNSKRKRSGNVKFEYILVYEKNKDKFDIGHSQTKVKVAAQL